MQDSPPPNSISLCEKCFSILQYKRYMHEIKSLRFSFHHKSQLNDCYLEVNLRFSFTILVPTLTGVSVPLVAGEASTCVAANVVRTVREYIARSEKITIRKFRIEIPSPPTCIYTHCHQALSNPYHPSHHYNGTENLNRHR